MGLLIGVGANKPTWPYDHYYGVEWDTAVSSPTLTRVGKTSLHVSLPIQSLMRRCLLNDAGEVVTYLGASNSALTDTGSDADLTGASGQVMVEIPKHYRKFEVDGTKQRILISQVQLPSFHEVPKQYVSAYEACVDRSVLATPKLCSVVNTATTHRGGNNTASWDGTYRSLLGKPSTNISLTNFRTYARNRGTAGLNNAGWNCYTYGAEKTIFWLFAVEYATFNSQTAYTAETTTEGYKNGGLGYGVTTLESSKWGSFNSYNPVIPCGTTNSLGNATGVVSYTMPYEYNTGVTTVVSVPSYRGVENPFGHINKHTDGATVKVVTGDEGNTYELYTCDNPANFDSDNVTSYTKRGETATEDGFNKAMIFGEYGEIVAKATGASSTTYLCDYFYIVNASGAAYRALVFGGNAYYGALAGLACVYSSNAASATYANVGSRLCFIPAAA